MSKSYICVNCLAANQASKICRNCGCELVPALRAWASNNRSSDKRVVPWLLLLAYHDWDRWSIDYKELLTTVEWRERRKPVLARDDFKCQGCGSLDGLEVHHQKYGRGCLPWEVPDEWLTTLCWDCHRLRHINQSPPVPEVVAAKTQETNTLHSPPVRDHIELLQSQKAPEIEAKQNSNAKRLFEQNRGNARNRSVEDYTLVWLLLVGIVIAAIVWVRALLRP